MEEWENHLGSRVGRTVGIVSRKGRRHLDFFFPTGLAIIVVKLSAWAGSANWSKAIGG